MVGFWAMQREDTDKNKPLHRDKQRDKQLKGGFVRLGVAGEMCELRFCKGQGDGC